MTFALVKSLDVILMSDDVILMSLFAFGFQTLEGVGINSNIRTLKIQIQPNIPNAARAASSRGSHSN